MTTVIGGPTTGPGHVDQPVEPVVDPPQARPGSPDLPSFGAPVANPPAGPPAESNPSGIPVRTVVRTGMLSIAAAGGLFLLWFLVLSGLSYNSAQQQLRSQFAGDLVDAVAPVNQPVDAGAPIAVLEIPAIGVDDVVVEGSTATETAVGPGHLRTSVFPGQPGTSVVIGRRSGFGGPFGRLADLGEGDEVRVTTGQGTAGYQVEEVRVLPGDDAAAFVAPGNTLVLVTSHPRLLASERLAVVARLEGTPFDRGTRVPQVPPSVSELALAGDSGAAVGVLVWLQVALAGLAAAIVLLRLWRRWPAWVLVGPVVAALAWKLFSQVALLLPAAL